MRKTTSLLILITLLFCISCEDDERNRQYVWSNTKALPYFDAAHKLKIINGSTLYMAGVVKGTPGIFRLDGETWTKIVETYGFADDFALYKGVMYFGNSYGFYRVANGAVETLATNEPQILAMEVFNDKLIITGNSILVDGKECGTVSFDGTTLTPISEFFSGYALLIANNRLYIGNYPVMEYDGEKTTFLPIGGQSNMTIDHQGNIYIAAIHPDGFGNTTSTIQKYAGGESVTLGEPLAGFIQNIQFFNGTIVTSGSAVNDGVSYYFKNNRWSTVDIPAPDLGGTNIIGSMVLYNDRVIGTQLISGAAVELK